MAVKIKREIKFWSENSGVSHHYGVEADLETDLHVTLVPGKEAVAITAGIAFLDQLLLGYVSAANKKKEES